MNRLYSGSLRDAEKVRSRADFLSCVCSLKQPCLPILEKYHRARLRNWSYKELVVSLGLPEPPLPTGTYMARKLRRLVDDIRFCIRIMLRGLNDVLTLAQILYVNIPEVTGNLIVIYRIIHRR